MIKLPVKIKGWELFLLQNRKCALSGVELRFSIKNFSKNKRTQTASLDRIDSSVGYIKGNVQWVHKIINQMKKDLPEQDFIKWCKLITDNKA